MAWPKGKPRAAETRARMSAARKAAWADRYEAEMQPRQVRETRQSLGEVPRDALEALIFGGGPRR